MKDDAIRLTEVEEFFHELLNAKQPKLKEARSHLQWLLTQYENAKSKIEDLETEVKEADEECDELQRQLDEYDDDKIAQNERIATAANNYIRSVEKDECDQVRNNDYAELARALNDLP
jgi:septal ring factor EnvC (AmiA/AmiB activator)